MNFQRARDWLVPIFLACTFYGDVFVGVTLPLSIFVLPAIFYAFKLHKRSGNADWPAGLFLLCGLGLIVLAQAALGHVVNGRSDAVAYLSIVYAAATLFVLRGVHVSDNRVLAGIVTGGLLTGVIMCVMIAAAPSARQLVPSQFLPGQESYAQYLERRGRSAEATESSKRADVAERFSPPADAASYEMYDKKRLARNALGFSNYIAAFLVFTFTVALFTGRRWASGFLALLVLPTFSRFGIVFLGLSLALWFGHRKGIARNRAACALLLAVAVGCVVSVCLQDTIAQFPQLASLSARIEYWKSGLEVLGEQPILGRPRSSFMDTFSLSILWNPHNSLLWIGSLFGLLGIGLYITYVALLLKRVSAKAASSAVWTGIFFGLAILLAWSLIEELALSPAFEILLASMYALSGNQRGQLSINAARLDRSHP